MRVVIHTMEGCPFCEKAKEFLLERGIRFDEVVTPVGSKLWRELREKVRSGSLPQILIDDAPIGGYADLVSLEASGELYEKLGYSGRKPATPLYDAIIIGAGPGGLSAAIYTIRKLLKTLIISKDIGGQVAWTADVENYLGFSQVNASELVAKFEEHVKRFGVEKIIGVDVTAVDLAGKIKKVVTEDGKVYYGRTLIIATGGRHRPLEIPGERELIGKGVSYCSTCDAPLFGGADVAVVGGGNSALEAAVDLINIANKIYLVSLTQLTCDPFLEWKVKESDKVEMYLEYLPIKVLGEKMVQGLEIKSLSTGDTKPLSVEGVFVEIGILPNSGVFVDTLATNQKGEILVDSKCRTGLAGVFACGDVTNTPFKQVVVAVGDGAKAALSAYNYLINQR
jgi:alkyl hydroperoxide reductase subunit F